MSSGRTGLSGARLPLHGTEKGFVEKMGYEEVSIKGWEECSSDKGSLTGSMA